MGIRVSGGGGAAGTDTTARSAAAAAQSTADGAVTQLGTKASLLPPAGSFTYDGSGNLTGSTDGLVLTYDGSGRVSTISDGTTTRTLNYSGTSTSPASVS